MPFFSFRLPWVCRSDAPVHNFWRDDAAQDSVSRASSSRRLVAPDGSLPAASSLQAARWASGIEAWTAAAASLVDLSDLQTQPIWQAAPSAEHCLTRQAEASLSRLDVDRVATWLETPLSHRIGSLAPGQTPKAGFVARLRAARPHTRSPIRWQSFGSRTKGLPTAAEAFAMTSLAHGHTALCVDILMPPEATGLPAWTRLLGAPQHGVVPPPEALRDLVWSLSLRAADTQTPNAPEVTTDSEPQGHLLDYAYQPALTDLLQYVFDAVLQDLDSAAAAEPHSSANRGTTPPATPAPCPPALWTKACLRFDFEAYEGPHVRRAQAVIIRGLRQAMASWLTAKLHKVGTWGLPNRRFGERVDALWTAFVAGIFAPTSVRGMVDDHFHREPMSRVVHDRFGTFCAQSRPFGCAKAVHTFVAERVAADIVTPLARGDMAPRRGLRQQVRRYVADLQQFGRDGMPSGSSPKTQARLLAQEIGHVAE